MSAPLPYLPRLLTQPFSLGHPILYRPTRYASIYWTVKSRRPRLGLPAIVIIVIILLLLLLLLLPLLLPPAPTPPRQAGAHPLHIPYTVSVYRKRTGDRSLKGRLPFRPLPIRRAHDIGPSLACKPASLTHTWRALPGPVIPFAGWAVKRRGPRRHIQGGPYTWFSAVGVRSSTETSTLSIHSHSYAFQLGAAQHQRSREPVIDSQG